MTKEKNLKRDPLARLFAGLRPNKDELAELKAAERSKDLEQFVRRLGELDRKYKMRSLETLGVDEGLINTKAFQPASEEIEPAYPVQSQSAAIVGQLAASKQLACDCIAPFRFRRLDVYNNTTSYDAKVWVDYYQVISVGDTLVEISGGEIHYDGTRSEDRTMNFNADRNLPPRYLFFNAPRAGDTLSLSLRIEVDTAANEDGLATGVIDMFGFPANTTHDYDSFVI